MTSSNSSSVFTIQPALAEHSSKIRNLILRTGINPSGLRWERFLVALTPDDGFIGCGQVKPHPDGTWELASIAVEPAWRSRGVGRALIEALLQEHPGELYLMCTSNLGPLYEKFGFMEVSADRMPKYFRRVSKLVGIVARFAKVAERMLVMRRSPS